MNKFSSLLITLPLGLAGCTMFTSGEASNVMQIGKDSYTVRALSQKSTSEAKMLALQQANGFCKTNGSHNVMLVKDYSGVENDTNEKFYDLTFMCLSQNDRDFTRISHSAGAASEKPADAQPDPTATEPQAGPVTK